MWQGILFIHSYSIRKSGGKGERSPGSSFFPMWFLMRTCDDELLFLLSTGWKWWPYPDQLHRGCLRLYICNTNICSYIIKSVAGGPVLTTSHLVRLSFLHLEPEFFVFFDRATDRLRWSFNAPRMPAVATMSEIRGRLCWICSSERARTDHFSRSLRGSRLYVREVAINDARSQETPINHGAMELEVEGDEIDARKPGGFTSSAG